MKALELRGISKHFKGIIAVDNVSLSLEEGTALGIMGPNGAGKTTLINLITGTLSKSKGEVIWYEEDITRLRPHQIAQRGIRRTFQNIRLFRSMSVMQNVLAGWHAARQGGGSKGKVEAGNLAEHLLREFKLYDKREWLTTQLSYGEQKRLELCRALAGKPKLLLLDEPVAGMNDREKEEMLRLMPMIRTFCPTMILVEHNVPFLMSVAERIVVLNFGEKIAEGNPNEVRTNPEVIEAYLGLEEEEAS